QVARQSGLRASIDAALLGEINRVLNQAGSPAVNAANIAADTIDGLLEERFAIDQQQAGFPGRPRKSNFDVANLYLLQYLGDRAGRTRWPAGPDFPNLITLFAQFLDDVTRSLQPAQKTNPGQQTNPPPHQQR